MEDDMIKLSPEDHMDIMNILMQNETHSQFTTEPQREIPTMSSANPAGPCGKIIDAGGAMMLPPTPTLMHHSNATLGSSMNSMFNTLSPLAAGTSLQESTVHPFQEHMMASRVKSGNSLPNNLSTHALSQYEKRNSMAAMREMIFRIAAMQPIHIDPEAIKPPKRRNVKISKDPQSVAARHRRERISERIRILQRLVPGGTKMDTASMLDEAIHYVKFLKKQVQSLEEAAVHNNKAMGIGFPVTAGTTPSTSTSTTMSLIGNGNTPPYVKANCQSVQQGWAGSSMQIFG